MVRHLGRMTLRMRCPPWFFGYSKPGLVVIKTDKLVVFYLLKNQWTLAFCTCLSIKPNMA